MRKLLPGLLAVALLVCVIPGAQAQQDSFFAGASSFDGSNNLNVDGNQYFNTDSGWFRNDGIHNAGNTNYITGYCGPNDCGGFYYHGYFSFDLGRLTGADTASFNVYSYLIQFDPGTYSIYGTSLSPSQVDSSLDYSDVTLYSALVSGPMIGSIFVTPSDSYSTVTVD
ncbi:MAG TPA: hypothetical protein VMT56_00650, partial [Candidatus Bathyarchaeia archaeon]|nr:hypothetical protein [Candidatus Bathyarchaeia archaeon]